MSRRAIWFGSEERPLFGWLHTPAGARALGGVVVCPTLGVEAMSAHRAMRELAYGLEQAGYLVLRFDYEGTGDSAGEETDEGLVAAWESSIEAAIALVRQTGAERVGLVGFRIGGTLAGSVLQRTAGVDALVLWDPSASGRSFIREQQALKAMSIGDTSTEGVPELTDGAVEILGSVLSRSVVDALGGIELGDPPGPLAPRRSPPTPPRNPPSAWQTPPANTGSYPPTPAKTPTTSRSTS